MQQNFQTTYRASTQVGSSHKVLRNTYALLALSMIPTIFGAVIGTNMNFSFMAGSPIMSSLIMMAVLYGLFFAVEKNRDSSMGVVLMMVLTLFMGILLGPLLQVALSLKNGAQLVMVAGGAT
ncbi:Bax inhibitor-1 family protein, partial [Craterilacuibacter sp.]|uniref:Bax inhibitor-1 family protein n=1 Tax=Craterilacuibacter sp. TaxID=2870909 RepID=UPI003F3BD6EF